MSMSLSENIKCLRNAAGINQTELAKALAISVKTISHWETGYTEPSVHQLMQLADYFDVTLDELVGRNRID